MTALFGTKEGKQNIDTRKSARHNAPLRIALVNLMPDKRATEMQFRALLSRSGAEIDCIRMASYTSKRGRDMDCVRRYKTYDEIQGEHYDAMIFTGAPVECIDYADIVYWEELTRLFDYAERRVESTMFICWAAQAALHYFYGIGHRTASHKIFGVYDYPRREENALFAGFDDRYYIPHSRHTYVRSGDVAVDSIDILAAREETGISLAADGNRGFLFNFGHWEYDRNTLHREYLRDLSRQKPIRPPENYYRGDDPAAEICVRWRASATLFFENWAHLARQKARAVQ
ncbi:homoserine O-succinyltransferase [Peptoniphilus ivorii]|uniref:homoserine O-succinyltransferase n=1 Tax=Aedoeadaptatus ivorii TaxID=54006 RepID=UPI00277FE42D|nr:homoserine O-succinyltransferase [Peptoniphilus ivorii]MDQ0507906.1 homoserine O-succinyltransferase [Peptoniphilus ivorii]